MRDTKDESNRLYNTAQWVKGGRSAVGNKQ